MPALRTINVTCPGCNTILVVNSETGEITEVRAPLVEQPSGDRFADALRAHKEHTRKVAGLFADSVAGVAKKEDERRALFEEKLKQAREQGLEEGAPLKDIDLD